MSVKETILSVLQSVDSNDGFISGQELAEKCGVTRTSVWKAIEALRRQGANIEAVTNRGYRVTSFNVFDRDSIFAGIKDKTVDVKFFEEIDSTNTQAKKDLAERKGSELHKTVYVAASQTAGRGRLGRVFYSPSASGIYLSVVYSKEGITKPSLFTANAAVAVARAIKKVFDIDAKIKWVNDVYVGGRKVCGILTEGIANFETGTIESVVIGIGVNIYTNEEQPESLKDIAGSLVSSSEDSKRAELCAEIINEIFAILEGDEEILAKSMEEYRNRSNLIGREIEFSPVINSSETNYFCTVQDITLDGKLVVKLQNGETKELESGEISIHSKVML